MAKKKKSNKKKRKQRRDNKITKHHLDPKSRGGSNDKKNKKRCMWKMHKAFNVLFVDFYLKTSYVILFLQIFGKDRFVEYRNKKNKHEFKKTWEILFGSLYEKQIISILKHGGQKNLRKQIGIRDIRKFRKLWKKLFRINLKSDEIIELLKKYGSKIFVKNKKAKQAWKILEFDGLTDEKVIEKIKREWSPKN